MNILVGGVLRIGIIGFLSLSLAIVNFDEFLCVISLSLRHLREGFGCVVKCKQSMFDGENE